MTLRAFIQLSATVKLRLLPLDISRHGSPHPVPPSGKIRTAPTWRNTLRKIENSIKARRSKPKHSRPIVPLPRRIFRSQTNAHDAPAETLPVGATAAVQTIPESVEDDAEDQGVDNVGLVPVLDVRRNLFVIRASTPPAFKDDHTGEYVYTDTDSSDSALWSGSVPEATQVEASYDGHIAAPVFSPLESDGDKIPRAAPGPFREVMHLQTGGTAVACAVRDEGRGGRLMCFKKFLKTELVKEKAVPLVLQELLVYVQLAIWDHCPFIMRLEGSLQDEESIYFAMVGLVFVKCIPLI
jgi:hypothetical protein